MYKHAGKFLNRLKGPNRRGRFTTQMTSTQTLTTIAPHRNPVQYYREPRAAFGSRVYLVRFTLRSNPAEMFLKIGISSMAIAARFQGDVALYEVEAVATSAVFKGPDALVIEKALHRAFRAAGYRPGVPLRSGNTECYQYTEDNLRRFAELVNAV